MPGLPGLASLSRAKFYLTSAPEIAMGFLAAPWHPLATMTPDQQKREVARLDYETLMADAAERLKYQVDLGKTMIQSLTFVNGGAIVALFTLIGKQGGDLALDPASLKRAFAFFIAGLIAALIAAVGGFASQYLFSITSTLEAWTKQSEMLGIEGKAQDHLPSHRKGNKALLMAAICAVLSLVCFGVGSWSALSGVLDQSVTIVAPE